MKRVIMVAHQSMVSGKCGQAGPRAASHVPTAPSHGRGTVTVRSMKDFTASVLLMTVRSASTDTARVRIRVVYVTHG